MRRIWWRTSAMLAAEARVLSDEVTGLNSLADRNGQRAAVMYSYGSVSVTAHPCTDLHLATRFGPMPCPTLVIAARLENESKTGLGELAMFDAMEAGIPNGFTNFGDWPQRETVGSGRQPRLCLRNQASPDRW
jgi:hypothetical protein